MTPPPPASGAKILAAVEQLSKRLDDKLVVDQRRDSTMQQILLELAQLTTAIHGLQNIVHNEHDTTRRALLMHFSGADLVEKEHGG